MNYNMLHDNTALLKVLQKIIVTISSEEEDIETLKKDLQEQIEENEDTMNQFDTWCTMKEQEAKYNVD